MYNKSSKCINAFLEFPKLSNFWRTSQMYAVFTGELAMTIRINCTVLTWTEFVLGNG